jgi:hypothetical protein
VREPLLPVSNSPCVENIVKGIFKPSTAFQESIDSLNDAIQMFTAVIGDLELKVSVEIFKEGKNLKQSVATLFDQMKSRFDSIESKVHIIAG